MQSGIPILAAVGEKRSHERPTDQADGNEQPEIKRAARVNLQEINIVINPTQLHLDESKGTILNNLLAAYPHQVIFGSATTYTYFLPGKKVNVQLTNCLLGWKSREDAQFNYEILGEIIATSMSYDDPKTVFKSAGMLRRQVSGKYGYESSNRVIKKGGNVKSAERIYEFGRRIYYLNTQPPVIIKVGTDKIVCILEDHVKGTELFDVLAKCYPFTTNQRLTIMINLISNLCYLNSVGIVHRDIKPENIIVNLNTLNVYILDFDLSKDISEDDKNFSGGSLSYVSAEIFSGKGTNILSDLSAVAKVGNLIFNGFQPDIIGPDGAESSEKAVRNSFCPYFQGLFSRINDLEPRHRNQIKQLFAAMTRLDRDKRCSPTDALNGFRCIYEERTRGSSSTFIPASIPPKQSSHVRVAELARLFLPENERVPKYRLARSNSFDVFLERKF
jgi:serine/threonine protein kinase